MLSDIFSERVKALRKDRRMTQTDLANATGLSPYIIKDIEACRRVSTPDTYITIADYFNVSTDYLFGRTDIPQIIRTA